MARRSYEIAHVLMTGEPVGGVWGFSLDLARGLAVHGVRTTLATMGHSPTTSQVEEAQGVPGLELHHTESRPDTEAAAQWLLALADRVRPDVVHLNGFAHTSLPWNVPSLVVAHGDAVSRRLAVRPGLAITPDLHEYKQQVQRGLSSASMVVSSTLAGLADLQRNYEVAPPSRAIPIGKSRSEPLGARKRPLVLSAARCWDESKNLNVLQQAARQVEWAVYVAGDLPQDRQPRMQEVNFLGRLCPGALSAWFSRASLYALPAKYDPDGLSALEAALAGCALVLADIPSLRELWNGVAIFAPADDSAAFAAAIQQFSEDPIRRFDFAGRALERAQRYSVPAMACDYLFAYQDLKQAVGLDLASAAHPGVSLL
ncbi:glycosyltransferase family 4 protein [Fimbriimonas ginsengisoli]|uniref:Glycosyl transferase group 1 n=1 Tax=Fimbriimonas ginsengisoli Gsoil 348 TaxID=661478 RepID=A0A068NK88_FIMGI|nr:glycosyltransferase family 4 protein [Fimbriimonas ginsengisoli]AIE83911.1 glycosyl transferase group 1 [Fimbriimonas ginsengisoli Gsoil 348]